MSRTPMPQAPDPRLWLAALGMLGGLAGCGVPVPTDLDTPLPDASTSADATRPDDPAPPDDRARADDARARDRIGSAETSAPVTDTGASPPADAGAVEAPADAADTDAAVVSNLAPQSGPFLDGSSPFDASASLDGNSPASDPGDADIPLGHRAAALCCPITRDPGGTCEADASFVAYNALCARDSDCTRGTNGRCGVFSYVNLEPQPGSDADPTPGVLTVGCESECSYDECFSDDDCPGHVPCDCRASLFLTNVCRKGSNCNVDSDCGQGGYCTPYKDAYYCHRPGDVCFNDDDCLQGQWGAGCVFETGAGQWQCVSNPPGIR